MSLAVHGALNTFQVAVKPPAIVQTGVVESRLDVQLSNLLDVASIQFEVGLDVLLNLPIDGALGNDGTTVADAPSKADLDGTLSILLTKFSQDGLVDDSHHV